MNFAMSNWMTADDPHEFKQALSCYATGITIVTGVTQEGARFGLTASSFQTVSLSPPLVLYSVRRGAASINLVKASKHFCVNVLRHDHAELARRFAAPIPDRFAGVDWRNSERGNPMLPDSIATFDCRLWATYDGGDHEIIIGEVQAIRRTAEGDPLVCFRGEFRPIGSSINSSIQKVNA